MRHLLLPLPGRVTAPRCRRSVRWPRLIMLVFSVLLLVLTVAPSAQAASLSKAPRKLTPAQIQAIHQQLKKQIHVKHTGKAVHPTTAASPKPLRPQDSSLPAYNNIGISDANTRSSANFDTANRSYSAQALQDVGLVPGISVTSQNITYIWPSVPTGQPDNYLAAGQVIPISSLPGAASVGFLGAADLGSASGTATLTYTDGTTTTFTLTLTDWWNGTAQTGNQQVVHMTTINTKHGTKSGNYYLYSVTTALDTSKTLQSVTLPTTTSPGQLHVFAVGVSGPAFNNVGISDDSNPGAANYDGGGANLSAQALASADLVPGQQFDVDGIAYTWPSAASGTLDNYQANGQVLPVVPVPNATTLGFLGSAAGGGNSTGSATITYTDGTTQTFTLGLSDWTNGTPLYGNIIAASMTYYDNSSGKQTRNIYLFSAEVALISGKTLQSVTLPTTTTPAQIHVFAVGTRASLNNLGTSNDSQPGEGNYGTPYGGQGSYSIQALAAAGFKQGQPFTFNGVGFTWPASYGSLADNYEAAGQTIPVTPVANATTIGFVGSAGYGPSTGTATLTYTDGTTSPFSLGFTDWWSTNCATSYGNLVVTNLSYINLPSGTKTGTYCLYYAETSLAAGKTLQSVTLPATVNQGQLHIFAIGTRSDYNNTGISDDSNPAGANFDGNGDSYSAEDFADPNVAGWNPGDTLTYEGINYVWPGVPAGQSDNYEAAGQTIPVTAVAGATTIGFVGASDNGSAGGSSGTATLTYTDGSTSTFTLGMSDWILNWGSTTPLAGNRLFALLPHINTPKGQMDQTSYLFEMETPLNASKTLQSVTLPSSVDQGHLHVFMIGTRAGENYPNNVGSSDDSDTVFANLDGKGASYSIEALEAAGVSEGQPFTFNGVTFTWPASYSVIPDNYQVAGQTLPVTPVSGATTLAFLGAATNAGSSKVNSGTAMITYTDGSTQTFTLALTDWWSSTAQSGNQVAATCSYINVASGQQTQMVYLYYIDVSLQAGKTIQSVTLPSTVSSGQMHVFAIGTK